MKNETLSKLVGQKPSTSCYIGLSTTEPEEDSEGKVIPSSITEPAFGEIGHDYHRVCIGLTDEEGSTSSKKMTTPEGALTQNFEPIMFWKCEVQGGWCSGAQINYAVFFNHPTAKQAENVIGWSRLENPQAVPYQTIANFDTGEVKVRIEDEAE